MYNFLRNISYIRYHSCEIEIELKQNKELDQLLVLSAHKPLSVILPTIEPKIDQFEEWQTVAQCDA